MWIQQAHLAETSEMILIDQNWIMCLPYIPLYLIWCWDAVFWGNVRPTNMQLSNKCLFYICKYMSCFTHIHILCTDRWSRKLDHCFIMVWMLKAQGRMCGGWIHMTEIDRPIGHECFLSYKWCHMWCMNETWHEVRGTVNVIILTEVLALAARTALQQLTTRP